MILLAIFMACVLFVKAHLQAYFSAGLPACRSTY